MRQNYFEYNALFDYIKTAVILNVCSLLEKLSNSEHTMF